MLFIVILLVVICMALVVMQIEVEEEAVSSSSKKVRRMVIARDRVGVAARNATCVKGHLPYLPSNGPSRSYRRSHNTELHTQALIRLREVAHKQEAVQKISIKKRSKLNRWIKTMMWTSTRNIRRKHIVNSPVWSSIIHIPVYVDITNYTLVVKQPKNNSYKEKKQWDILQSRAFQAIVQGDTSPTTRALYEAAREMVRAA